MSISVGGIQALETRQVVSREVSVFTGSDSDAPYKQIASREVGVLVTTPQVPARISKVTVTFAPTGESTTLSWSDYNQWAEKDIAFFRVYVSTSPFTDISAMTPYATVPVESWSVTLNGLAAWQDRFFAVVPVDDAGGFDSVVNYSAAYLIAKEVDSREWSVFIGVEPEPPLKQIVSRETSIVVTTAQTPTRISHLQVVPSPTGESTTVSWTDYNQWAEKDVDHYNLYMSATGFNDVSKMTPYLTVGGETLAVTLNGLAAWQDRFYAVVPVDAAGGYDPIVNYSAAYLMAREVPSRELSIFVGAEPEPPYRQVASREISVIVPTTGVPAPVTGIDSGFAANESSGSFRAIDLDWSSYNEVAQNDVMRYRVYTAWSYFEDVSGMTPYAYAPADTKRWTITGLNAQAIYYVAVVAEDALGQGNPTVRAVSAQASIGQVGEVRDLSVVCGANSLQFTWRPPEGAEPQLNYLLAGYRVYFDGASIPVTLDRQALSYSASGLLPARGYRFVLAAVDFTGAETPGSSLPAATLLGHPATPAAESFDGMVRLTWNHVEPNELVKTYAVYVADTSFSSVAGRTPALLTRGRRADLAGLANGTRYYFAVTTVNIAGGEAPEVQTVSAVPQVRSGNFADLQLTGVTGPATAYPGGRATFGWRVANLGTALTSGPDGTPVTAWTDRIVLSRDDVLGDADDLTVATIPHVGTLAPGAEYATSVTVKLPKVEAASYHVFVICDALDEVYEFLDAGNNIGSASITIGGAAADLVVEGVTAPASALSGQAVVVSWVVSNPGGLGLENTVWSEQIAVSNALDGIQVLAENPYTSSLGVDEQLARSQSVTLPDTLAAGDNYFVITVDSQSQVAEMDELNNTALSDTATVVPALLKLTLPSAQIAEGGTMRPTLRRNGGRAQALTVTLTSSDASELSFSPTTPLATATVTIPAGAASAAFDVWALRDQIVDGPQPVTLGVAADGYQGAAQSLTVLDIDVLKLALSFGAASVTEGMTVSATVSRNGPTANPLAVVLNSTSPSQLSPPDAVTIPAGASSWTFAVLAVDDNLVETPTEYTVTASAPGFDAASASVTVVDNDLPEVVVTLASATVSEGAGPQATFGTVTRSFTSARALTVELVSSDPTAALVPARVTIPANGTSTSFPVAAVDDTLVDGPQTTWITPYALTSGTNVRLGAGTPALLTVTDDDGPTLTLVAARKLVPEGLNPATTVTVTRNTTPTAALVVTLASSDTSEATVPASVTIPAGQVSADFPMASVADGVQDGNHSVTLTASAPNYTDGSVTVVVSDVELPDLVVSKVSGPLSAETDTYMNLTYRVSNQGLGAAGGNFLTRIYLSKDPVVGDDTLVGQYRLDTELPVGMYFEQTLSVRSPLTAGNYWVVVETDAEQAITETLEDNNTGIGAMPIVVGAGYGAYVQAGVASAPAGTPVPLSGRATNQFGFGAPFKLVNIHLQVRGTERIISALADANGYFTTVWQPLATEGGRYQIFATHPGVARVPVQGEFTLLGMAANPANASLTLLEQASRAGVVQLENLTEVPLTGLSVAVASKPADLAVEVDLGSQTTLAGLGTLALNYRLKANTPNAFGTVVLRVSSTEGAAAEIHLAVSVEALRPRLVALPDKLMAGMARGRQTVVEFDLVNLGGVETGPLTLSLPNVPWLKSATANPLPDLLPGQTNHVVLLLTPAADLPLGPYTGNLAVEGTGTGLGIPFDFRALSEAKGDLLVTAVDEYTYYAEGLPKLAGATVTVRDAVSRAVAANGVTDANGEFLASQLQEAYYEIEVTAEKHTTYRNPHLILAGTVNKIQTFLSRQVVTYNWTVVPIEIEDRYKITIDTTFETVVPIPVVTVEPAVIDLAEITADVTQMEIKISNHGLIAANNTRLTLPTHPLWEFESIVNQIGTLPANSSLSVPLTIRRVSQQVAGEHMKKASADLGPCYTHAYVCWELVCGTVTNKYCGDVTCLNARPGCGASLPMPGGNDCVECGNSSSVGWGSMGDTYGGPPTYTATTSCDPCFFKRLGAILECAVGFVSVPVPEWVDCVKQIIECLKGWPDGFDRTDGYTCTKAALQCVGASEKLFKILQVLECDCKILTACQNVPGHNNTAVEAAAAGVCNALGITKAEGSLASLLARPQSFNSEPELAPLLSQAGRISALADYLAYLFGSYDWFQVGDGDEIIVQNWVRLFLSGLEEGSDGGRWISGAERSALLAIPLPRPISGEDATNLLDRWNRSLDYWGLGISRMDQVPSGQSTNFIAIDVLRDLAIAAGQAMEESERLGYASVTDGVAVEIQKLKAYYLSQPPSDGICARVKLRTEQEAVIARDAFRATLEIDNSDTARLEEIEATLTIKDETGVVVANLFGIRPPELVGLTGVTGGGVLAGQSTGTAKWVIIPTVDAVPGSDAVRYFVSGQFSYTQGGTRISQPLAAVPITVLPSPRLTLKYFHQRDVYGDDPFTDIVEPSIPFNLGVMVQNKGYGVAKNFRITSAQPKIVENEKGLLIDFQIIGTEVAGRNLVPSLTAEFGDIEPGANVIGRWLMTSTLQGLFIDYSATFEHIDGLGMKQLSLIDEVSIHELIHLVQAGGALEDGKPDFLVNDVPDVRHLPDTLYLSDGSTNPVQVVEQATQDGPPSMGHLEVQLQAAMPSGWTYLRVPEMSGGHYRLTKVTRLDGAVIPFDLNVWVTDRTFVGMGRRPVPERILHLLDYNSPGQYTLTYEAVASDVTPPGSRVAALPAASYPRIAVNWTGQDDAGGSGIAAYDIYVSVNDGPFTRWLERTTVNENVFFGEPGKRYAFYSVAVDQAGNRQAAPATPDAVTTVSLVNRAPTLASVADVAIDEGSVFTLALSATDPDPFDTLTFSLIEAPAGMAIVPGTGFLRWTTGEADGPGTYRIVAQVQDNANPPATATVSFNLTVREVNTRPVLAPLGDHGVVAGELLTVAATATDADLPANHLTFSLDAGAPVGATIDPASGRFQWRPSAAQAPGPYRIEVMVTDDGQPALTATAAFTATVQAANQPPVVALAALEADYVHGLPATPLDVGAMVSDPDTAVLAGGLLSVAITQGAATEDRLLVLDQPAGQTSITVTENQEVRYGPNVIGNYSGGTNDTYPLLVSLNANATLAAVQALTRRIGFTNESVKPSTTERTIQFVLSDGQLGTSAPVALTVKVSIAKATPKITWAAPADIVYGTALGEAQLHATADVPGIFTYTPSSGQVLGAGDGQRLSAHFVPNDQSAYKEVDQQVAINVLKAPLTIAAENKTKVSGAPLPALTVKYTGFVPGDTAAKLTTLPVVATKATASSPAGGYPITVDGAAGNDYAITFVSGTLTVTAPALSFDVSTLTIPKSTPTQVTFQLYVPPSPNFIVTSPNVQRKSGTTWVVAAAQMYDDGTHGDTTPGDSVYAVVLALNEPTVGTIQFRSSVSYKGQLQRVFSNTNTVTVAAAPAGPSSLTIKVGSDGRATGPLAALGVAAPAPGPVGLQAEPAGVSVTLSVSTVPGKTYVLEFTENLVPALWIPLAVIEGDGEVKSFVESELAVRRYYRIREK